MSEFADKLIQVMGGSVKNEDEESLQTLHPKNWEKLGDKVQSIINTPPYFSYMLGSLPTGNDLDIFRPAFISDILLVILISIDLNQLKYIQVTTLHSRKSKETKEIEMMPLDQQLKPKLLTLMTKIPRVLQERI